MKSMALRMILMIFCCFASVPVHADTILSVTGNSSAGIPFSGGLGLGPQYLGVAFSLSQTFNNVSIAAPGIASNSSTPTAWLVNAIGPTATPANVIASAPFFSGPLFNPITTPLLSSLNLGPGVYYFIVSTPAGSAIGVWPDFSSPTIFSSPNASLLSNISAADISGCGTGGPCLGTVNFAFPAASTWSTLPAQSNQGLAIAITGTPVPEPASGILLGAGLLALVASRRKTTKA